MLYKYINSSRKRIWKWRILKIAASYDDGKAVIKQNSPSGKVHGMHSL